MDSRDVSVTGLSPQTTQATLEHFFSSVPPPPLSSPLPLQSQRKLTESKPRHRRHSSHFSFFSGRRADGDGAGQILRKD